MIEATAATIYNARCDRCRAEHDTPDYSDRDDLLHDLRVMGWNLDYDNEHLCPACVRRDDLERPNVRLSTYCPPA